MEVRLATKEDIEGILVLQPQVHRAKDTAENSSKVLESLIDVEYCDVIVAKDGEAIAGSAFIFYHPAPMYGRPYAMLEDMVVDERVRGKGVGSNLMEKVIELAGKRRCYKIIFNSGFDREKIHQFYEKIGFKKWGLEFRMDLD